MNTIPSTFNQRHITHAVLGGTEAPKKVSMPVTCLVLTRASNQYRSRVFQNLTACGFEKIISVQAQNRSYATEELSLKYPTVKFVAALEDVTPGDMVNLGMAESESPYVLLVYDDLCVTDFKFSAALAQKLIAMDQFCLCPRLMTADVQNLPVRFSPGVNGAQFVVDSSLGIVDRAATLYPADLAGFYDRRRFVQLGGFDYTIQAPYWQKADFFFRAWLWGEQTRLATSFSLSYAGDVPEEDHTATMAYLHFYLKNLLPCYKNDHAELPLSLFFPFRRRSSCGFHEALRLFRRARQWVKENKYRFKQDAVALTEGWGEGARA